MAAKDEELRATLARYREANAEFEQARARMRRDVAKEVERGARAVLADLLDVVDNLDRAIEAARAAGSDSALLQGVDMVRAQFWRSSTVTASAPSTPPDSRSTRLCTKPPRRCPSSTRGRTAWWRASSARAI